MRQLDLFPPPPHRYQSLADLDAQAVKACEYAHELHDACRDDPRATRALFSALMIFGAIEILKRRGWEWDASPYDRFNHERKA